MVENITRGRDARIIARPVTTPAANHVTQRSGIASIRGKRLAIDRWRAVFNANARRTVRSRGISARDASSMSSYARSPVVSTSGVHPNSGR
jgi:hypothetical protein